MIRRGDSVEIYAREINEPVSLELFLRAQMYGCLYEASSKITQALYFSPHFARTIANLHPGVGVGISYAARILAVETATGWSELDDLVKEKRGKPWANRQRTVFSALRKKWGSASKKRTFLFLGEPRLVFNPPVRKTALQSGRGRLAKRFFTFDELFKAWGDT